MLHDWIRFAAARVAFAAQSMTSVAPMPCANDRPIRRNSKRWSDDFKPKVWLPQTYGLSARTQVEWLGCRGGL